MSAETYRENVAKMDKIGSDTDAYTYYGTLRTPKRKTITVNGEEVSRTELGRRLVGVLAKNIEINGRTFKADEIGNILVDALEEAANPKLDAHRYEHVVEMAKMCGADIGYELDWLVLQALYVWKNIDGGMRIPRKEYMPNTIELCKRLHISTDREEDETEDDYNENLTDAVERRWTYGTAADRVKIYEFVFRTVNRVVYDVTVNFKHIRATPNDEDRSEFDRELDEVEQGVEE